LLSGEPSQNLAAFLSGAEGTLVIAKRIELKLVRLPGSRAIGVCHFASPVAALRAVERILTLDPTNIELTSKRIVELGLDSRTGADPVRRLLRKDGTALLIVEFMEENSVTNARKLKDLTELMASAGHPRSVSELIGPAAQEAARRAHRAGLSRLYGMTSKPQGFTRIDQLALPLRSIAGAAERISSVFERAGIDVLWHGQAGVGALYLRPWIRADAAGASIADAVEQLAEIARSYGDEAQAVDSYGLARSFAAERNRDGKLTALYEALKTRFDPQNRLNPGKIVFPAEPVSQMMRSNAPDPLDYAGSALNCDGTAVCRRLDKSVMCPSFKLTRDERDSPRGRANSLRLALSGDLGPDALASADMGQTMSLCVSCKACRSECPRSVDITRARTGVQREQLTRTGLSKYDSAIAYLPHNADRLRAWRHVLNLRDILPWAGRLSERLTGVSADRPWPHWSAAPFPRGQAETGDDGAEILLFLDTFNAYFDPVTLRSAADVLEASGFRVHTLAPPEGERPFCCGRTFFETGLIDEARSEARRLIQAALPFIEKGIPLVGVEPACMLTMRDEFVNLLAEDGAREVAAASLLFEEVMSQSFAVQRIQDRLMHIEAEALFAAHCHQRSFGTAAQARKVAGIVPGIKVIEADPACCGMGTSFGYRPETVETSFRMGELSLFPQIRRAARDTLIISDGFACRRQISDGTGRTARHTAVLLKLALAAKERFGAQKDDAFRKDSRLGKRLTRLQRHYFR